jgi:hypothetical protein
MAQVHPVEIADGHHGIGEFPFYVGQVSEGYHVWGCFQ